MPLIRDPESTIQESVIEWTQFLILDRAAAAAGPAGRTAAKKAGRRAAEAGAAAAMAVDSEEGDGEEGAGDDAEEEEEEEEVTPAAVATAELRPVLAAVSDIGRAAGACLGKVCATLGAKKKLQGKRIAHGVEAFVSGVPSGSPEALGAWMLLKEVAGQEPAAPSWQFLQGRWTALQQAAAAAHHHDEQDAAAAPAGAEGGGEGAAGPSLALAEEGALLLLVISAAAESFPAAQASALAAQLLQATLAFNLPPAASAAHIVALHKLTSAGDASGAGSPETWCRQAYAAAHQLLHQYVSGGFGPAAAGASEQQQLVRLQRRAAAAIFAVGELALLRVARPPAGVTVLLQALTAPKLLPGMAATLDGDDNNDDDDSAQPAADKAAADKDAADGEGAEDDDEEGAKEENAREVPVALQGHAWISLGKVCLVDEALAKKLVPLFIQVGGPRCEWWFVSFCTQPLA